MNIGDKNRSKLIITEYPVEEDEFEQMSFSEYLRLQRKEANMNAKELAKAVGYDYETFRKFTGKQREPRDKRDFVIAIGIVLGLYPGSVDEALVKYGYLPVLSKDNERDKIIIFSLSQKNGTTIQQVNERLSAANLPELKLEEEKSNNVLIKKKHEEQPQYKIRRFRIEKSDDVDWVSVDSDSLGTRFLPEYYEVRGIMTICRITDGVRFKLVLDSNGHIYSELYSHHKNHQDYASIDDTGDFKEFFFKIQSAVNRESRKLLDMLDDTKNYYRRVSGRLIGDSFCVFAEEYNYIKPELDEYYLLTYSEGRYELHTYSKSAFMKYYLSEEEYKRYYPDNVDCLIRSRVLTDVEEFKIQKNMSEENYVYTDKKEIISELITQVDRTYEEIKNGQVAIFADGILTDEPNDIYEYYGLENDFKCVYDETLEFETSWGSESGAYVTTPSRKKYELANGSSVVIRDADIAVAFWLGFRSFEEICRIVSKYGSVWAVLS